MVGWTTKGRFWLLRIDRKKKKKEENKRQDISAK